MPIVRGIGRKRGPSRDCCSQKKGPQIITVRDTCDDDTICVLVAQSRLTLSDSTNCGLPGSSVHGIFQARKLEGVAFPSPGDLPDPGVEPASPTSQGDSLLSGPPERPVMSTPA